MMKAVLVNLSEVVLPAMEAYGRANEAALDRFSSLTGIAKDELQRQMRETPLPEDAYLPGKAPLPEKRTTLFANNTFYPLDWLTHLPAFQDAAEEVFPDVSRVYNETLQNALQPYEDFIKFAEDIKGKAKLVLIPDVKANYTSIMVQRSGLRGTFDHIFAPAANPLAIATEKNSNMAVTVLPHDIPQKPAPGYIAYVAKEIGIKPENWIVIGAKPDKDGNVTQNGGQFVQIKRVKPEDTRGTDFMKSLSDYQQRRPENEGQQATPVFVIRDFNDAQLRALVADFDPGQKAEQDYAPEQG